MRIILAFQRFAWVSEWLPIADLDLDLELDEPAEDEHPHADEEEEEAELLVAALHRVCYRLHHRLENIIKQKQDDIWNFDKVLYKRKTVHLN